jgi:predicted MFS family arabinose efflux permease
MGAPPGSHRAAAATGKGGARHPVRAAEARLDEAVGGPARRRVVVVLAAVLALDTVDKAAMSAVAGGVKSAFGVGNTGIGVLVSVVSLVGAVLTLPMGVLVDRARRTRLLWLAIALWTVAMIVSGAATSFTFLLITRVALGGITALAAPAVASLIGDYFPARDRGRIYGMVLAGELVGLGVGFLVAGVVSDLLSWRWAFWALAPLSAVVAWIVRGHLPEPARGGQSWLRPGAEHVRSEEDAAAGRFEEERDDGGDDGDGEREVAQQALQDADIEPRRDRVLREDPQDRSLWWAMKYVLSIPTTRVLIVASSLVYFYFSGIRAFAIVFVTGHFGISRSLATLLLLAIGVCAIAGVVVGGRLSDRLIRRGNLNGRVLVAPVALLATTALFAPAVLTSSVWIALPLFAGAAAGLAAANPPLDAARLDIMPPMLWGRAESIRQFLRGVFEAAAPTLFGVLSAHVFGGGTAGLQWTFLVMLVALLLGAVVAVLALRTYKRDVATAAASAEQTGS